MQIPAEVKKRPNYKPYTDPSDHKGKNYLPEPEGPEKAYIISVKSNAPFDNVSVCHFAFHKVIKSRPDENRRQKDLAAVFKFTDNQLEAFKLKAEAKEMRRMDGDKGKVPCLEMLEIEQLPEGGEYVELMDLQSLRAAMMEAVKARPLSDEEIDAEIERLQELKKQKAEKVVEEIEDKGKAKEQEKEKALESAEEDEEEELAKKKPKRRRR